MAHIRINGFDIAYRIDGEASRPWLVLAHALATNSKLWDAQIEAFTRTHKVLRYDARGHGASGAPPGPYSIAALVNDVVALMDALEIERAAYVGVSMGGIVGLGLALEHPDRVSRLVCCAARADSPPAYAQVWAQRIELARSGGMQAVVDATVGRWFVERPPGTPGAAERIEKARRMVLETSVEGYCGCAAALQNLSYLQSLHRVQVPVHYIAAERDCAIPVEVMREMHEATPGSTFTVIPDAAHLCNLEQPERFNGIVGGWL